MTKLAASGRSACTSAAQRTFMVLGAWAGTLMGRAQVKSSGLAPPMTSPAGGLVDLNYE
jgi:hypothetical protein